MYKRYPVKLIVNGRCFDEVVIDPHYKKKHGNNLNDTIIVALVRALNKKEFAVEGTDNKGFQYYKTDPLFYMGLPYRLVWLTHPNESFIGVRTAFRRRYGKKRKK